MAGGRSAGRGVRGGITAPLGFRASGVWSGIKRNRREDLALIYSLVPARCAGVFTRNAVQAAPILVTRARVRQGTARGVLVNSGNANCCTGRAGIMAAEAMGASVAQALGVAPSHVLVASTGVIGVPLPLRRIVRAVPRLVGRLSRAGGQACARGILTTDRTIKQGARQIELGGRRVTIGGVAKGSGMIAPHMATMLAFFTTDARVSPGFLRAVLRDVTEVTFNAITVDGDMSTNDMAILLANGLAGNRVITGAGEGARRFQEALRDLAEQLAIAIVRDGEGATKVIRVVVRGAGAVGHARAVARAVAQSPLVKTFVHGADPNWGRVVASVGAAPVALRAGRVEVRIGDVLVVRRGEGVRAPKRRLRHVLSQRDVALTVHLHSGRAEAVMWSADLSAEYVRINSRYTS